MCLFKAIFLNILGLASGLKLMVYLLTILILWHLMFIHEVQIYSKFIQIYSNLFMKFKKFCLLFYFSTYCGFVWLEGFFSIFQPWQELKFFFFQLSLIFINIY